MDLSGPETFQKKIKISGLGDSGGPGGLRTPGPCPPYGPLFLALWLVICKWAAYGSSLSHGRSPFSPRTECGDERLCVARVCYYIGVGLGWRSLGGLPVWLELAIPGKAACEAGIGDPWEGCL